MTEIVLPNDTNTFGNLMGGRLMYWMDIAAALSAMQHCASPVVALDPNWKPNPIIKIIPETDDEIRLFDGALRRRQLRLILGGKMSPNEAVELKALFIKG